MCCSLIICSSIMCYYRKKTTNIRRWPLPSLDSLTLGDFYSQRLYTILEVYPMRRLRPLQSLKNKQNKDHFLNCGHREICNHSSLKGSLNWLAGSLYSDSSRQPILTLTQRAEGWLAFISEFGCPWMDLVCKTLNMIELIEKDGWIGR